ncbi:MAG: hypothetical protein LBG11_04135 [Bifidobacteriaceae bacterium]|nr:hypothetical protein [Bifidobacteriaceae bacterium]
MRESHFRTRGLRAGFGANALTRDDAVRLGDGTARPCPKTASTDRIRA